MSLWEAVDMLVERAPDLRALRAHRLHLLAARRGLAQGRRLAPALARERDLAAADALAVRLVLDRVRAAADGPLVLIKGPEVAVDYPAPGTRPFGDIDLLVGDAAETQRALLAAGFRAVHDPAVYAGIHHLQPLWWPGLSLVVELHTRPKWPAGLTPPRGAELLARAAVPARVGVTGIDTLPAAEHALVLAAHAWAHEPLGRAGQLVDVAATLARADRAAADRLAAEWNCARLWRTVSGAADRLAAGERSLAAAIWARHLRGARERTVLEAHVQDWLAPLWGLPVRQGPAAARRAAAADLRRDGSERWRRKLGRTRLALRDAGTSKSEHDRRVQATVVGGGVDE